MNTSRADEEYFLENSTLDEEKFSVYYKVKKEEVLKKKHLKVFEREYNSKATVSRGSPTDVSFSSHTAARPVGAKKKSVFVVKRSIKELTIPEEPNLNTERRAAFKRKSLAPNPYEV